MEVKVDFKGISLVVSGNYTPPEEQVRYYSDGSGYSGSSSYFEVDEVFVEDSSINISELFSFEDFVEIEELCLTKIED